MTSSSVKAAFLRITIRAVLVGVPICGTPGQAQGQRPPPDSARSDSLRAFRLGEIVVTGSTEEAVVPGYTQRRIGLVDISRTDASSVAELGRLIPAAHVQTNSRGETLVYLRNAGERQVAVFFDGALLNIPWDNRVDLSLVPASVIGEITVAKGVPPVEYGVNVLGGAVTLLPREAQGPWAENELSLRYGTENRREGSFTHRAWYGQWAVTGALSFSAVDGLPVPSDAELPFSQLSDALRTNTDSRITNLFASAGHDFTNGSQIELALIHVDARKGIAPEGHRDPAISGVRFWRYPEWQNSMLILNGQVFAGATFIKGAAWVTKFGQTIESFASGTYDALEATQKDDDLTFGTRLVVSREIGSGTFKLAFNGLTSGHKQRDIDTQPNGDPIPGETFPRLEYQQHTTSVGAEWSFVPAERWSVSLGAAVDAMFTPKTGDKPERDPFVDYSVTGGVSRMIGETGFVRAAVGRKTRFPTMRELFGDALNRFLLNPDLTSEASTLVELAFGFASERLSGEIIPFGSFTTGTIDQQNVQIPGEPGTRRQRVNLAGSRVLGVELVGTAVPVDDVTLQGHMTLMDVVRKRDQPTDPTVLSEKPEAVGRVSAEFHPQSGFNLQLETVYTGEAFSLNDDDVFVPLESSILLNVRASQEVHVSGSQTVEVFLRADNVADAVALPQLGLPGPGRTVSGGVSVLF